MKSRLVKVFLVTFLIVTSSAASGADFRSLLEQKENGTINWSDGVVEAKGIGLPPNYAYYSGSQAHSPETISDAINIAQHNLLETIVNIRINSELRVIDIVENFPSVMFQLRNMVHKAPEVEELRKYLTDGTVEVWSQMSLRGGFSQLILPPEIRQIEPIKQVTRGKNPVVSGMRSHSSEIYTGLVVDARGLQAVPVLAPKILDENLEEVFGPAYASREFAVQWGMVSFTIDVRKAKNHLRVSDNPLIVKALKSLWPGSCNFIISNADADKLRSASAHLVFLKECRVVIVIDPL